MIMDALLSDCNNYRYWLTRTWDVDKSRAVFVGLNPSTADAHVDDATIRRCVAFSRDWGCGGLVMLNLFALRSTDPRVLKDTTKDPIGEFNDSFIQRFVCSERGPVVCCWGNNGQYRLRYLDVLKLIRPLTPVIMCFAQNNSGQPKHPLYVKGDTILRELELSS